MSQHRAYEIPPGASPEARKWIEQAQARLDYFAGQPEYRHAYEREVLELMQHNTLLSERHAEGRAEGLAEGRQIMLTNSVEKFRDLGLTDEQIIIALELTPHEIETYLK